MWMWMNRQRKCWSSRRGENSSTTTRRKASTPSQSLNVLLDLPVDTWIYVLTFINYMYILAKTISVLTNNCQISMGSTCWGKLCAEWYLSFLRAMIHWGLGTLLLSWINLNLNMDKYNHIHRNVGWNYLSFRKLQRLHRWSLGMYNLIPYFIIGVITYTCWG